MAQETYTGASTVKDAFLNRVQPNDTDLYTRVIALEAGGAAPVDSVNTKTGVVVLDPDDLSDTATTNKFATAAELAAITANTAAQHAESHTVVSHSDTSAAGAELDELTDGSETTLHSHAATGVASDLTVQDEGITLDAAVTKINFLGAGVTAAENADHEIDVTVAGGAAPVDSVNTKTGVVVLDPDDLSDTATTNKFATAAELAAITANTAAQHAESHTVVSHSDTSAAGAELDELTDGSETTLHSHADALITHVTADSTGTLSAANCAGTLINNLGQAAANTQTLPAAATGLNFIAQISTSGTGAFNLKAGTGDKIYLDGVALDDGDKVSCATPTIGNFITFWTIPIASAWDWVASSGQGDWTDGGA